MKILAVLALALFVAGCQTNNPTVIQTKLTAVDIPEELLQCPGVDKLPRIKTLTEGQVAKLLVNLSKSNEICRANMDAVRRYVRAARATVSR